jgi:hypothetical protein
MLDFSRNSAERRQRAQYERHRLVVLLMMLGVVIVLGRKTTSTVFWTEVDRAWSPQAEGNRGEPTVGDSYFPGVEPDDLEAIRDDSPSLRDEQQCSLRLLDILHHTNNDALRAASLGPVSYAQLFCQPDQYRGRLVTVSGVVRRANRVPLASNSYGIKDYHQVWLWPSDSPTEPIVIYCLDLPKGFPEGTDLVEEVEVTGFFFKRWAYQAKEAIRTAPEILARTLQWRQTSSVASETPTNLTTILLAIGAAALLSLLAAWYVYARTESRQPDLPERLPNLDGLRKMDHQEGPADGHAQ